MTEPLLALKTAVVLFGLAAAGGVLMLLIRLRGAPRPPSLIAMIHGLMAGAGLTLLIYFGVTTSIPDKAKAAVAVFLLAALGGVWLNVKYHSNLQPLPVAGILAHAAVAVAGFVLLVLAVLSPV